MRHAWAVLLGVACAPTLSSSDALITAPRVIAVRAEPAEAKPGSTVLLHALVASPAGASAEPPRWAFCVAPEPLTEDGIVSNACLDGAADLRPVGEGTSLTASTPPDGCSLFGPDTSAGAARPRDPDASGGYYQPLRIDLGTPVVAVDLLRISCDLASASAGAAAAFAQAYVPNENPVLLPLVATVSGSTVGLDAIKVGTRVNLTASWPSSSAEKYAYYDASTDAVRTQRESMTVAWYSSSGSIDREATGRTADDPGTSSDNFWTAPSAAGASRIWIVLRDSRGGVDFASYDMMVTAR